MSSILSEEAIQELNKIRDNFSEEMIDTLKCNVEEDVQINEQEEITYKHCKATVQLNLLGSIVMYRKDIKEPKMKLSEYEKSGLVKELTDFLCDEFKEAYSQQK